jgi:hypothetical protein
MLKVQLLAVEGLSRATCGTSLQRIRIPFDAEILRLSILANQYYSTEKIEDSSIVNLGHSILFNGSRLGLAKATPWPKGGSATP